MNRIGEALTLTLFGASHDSRIGCIIDGIPPGFPVNEDLITADLALRKPSEGIGTQRVETDIPEISGVVNGTTTGSPVVITFSNSNTRSSDYEQLRRVPRPGHADYPAVCKYGSAHDIRGGGMFSGRMTTPLVAAGALLRDLIGSAGISVGSYVTRIGSVIDTNTYDPADVLTRSRINPLRAMSSDIESRMRTEILTAKSEGDSVGGIVRCFAAGLPAGLGEPFFDTLDGEISKAVFAIPGVKAIGFGEGFAAAGLRGSGNNDAYRFQGDSVVTLTNHAGGVLGGMASGGVLDFSVAFKPTPSIAKQQMSVDLVIRENVDLSVKGRHDPCIANRGAIVVEAMTVFTLADLALRGGFLV
ncbi:MAG: chorismate synthase [Methanocorpusculum sp.]|uniref:chorismate synthase n=1 Tax=Methanocorpusculum sp. TaxID=2058474 RepID=UPI002726DF7E|nr:chorismate synthase [Methanocorpusculum sp.]MDO9522704.1 chorismate synthase [Methanocorpusculum sp.]